MLKKIFFILLFCLPVASFCDDATRMMVYEQLQKLTPLKLYGGNIELVGEDQLVKQELAQWVKLTIKKSETIFGSPLKFQNHTIRLVIQSEPSDDKPFVTTSIFNDKVLQRLVITDVNNFDIDFLELLFAEVITRGYVYDQIPKAALLISYKNITVPYWLRMGLARSFYSHYKENDAEKGYMAWKDGKVLPLRNIFENNLWSTYTSGIFLNSIRRENNYREKFNKIFITLANDFNVDYFWIQQNIFDVDDNDFLIFWDNCFYIQKYIIYVPRKQLNNFERYILQQSLYTFQGYSGIPIDKGLPEALSPIMITQYKDETWVNHYINSKTRQLQVGATGKSEQFRKITNKICEYIVNIKNDMSLKDQILQYRDIQQMIDEPVEQKNVEP